MNINLYKSFLICVFILVATLYSPFNIIFFPLVTILVVLFIFSEKKLKINIPIATYFLFIIFLLTSLLWTIDLYNSFTQTLFIGLLFISLIIFRQYIGSDFQKIEKFLFILILAGSILSLRNLFDFILNKDGMRFGGIVEQSNGLALLCSSLSVFSLVHLYLFSFNKTKMIVCYLVLVSSVFYIVVSGSRGGLISLLIFCFFIFVSFNKVLNIKFILFLSSLILLFYFNFERLSEMVFFQRILLLPQAMGMDLYDVSPVSREFNSAANDIRTELADIAIEKFLENPVLGHGINSFSFFSEYNYTHNNFLEIIFSLGIVGAILFYFPLIYIFIRTFVINSKFIKFVKVLRALILYYIISGMSLPNFQSKIQLFVLILILSLYAFIEVKQKSIMLNNYSNFKV